MGTSGDSLPGPTSTGSSRRCISREPVGRHNQHYSEPQDVAIRRPIGRMAALLGTQCGAAGPQEAAEPVKVDRTTPARNRLQRPQNSPHRGFAKFPRRACPAWVHLPRSGPGGTAGLADGPHMALTLESRRPRI